MDDPEDINTQKLCVLINGYLKRKFGCKSDPAYDTLDQAIYAKAYEFDIYLRCQGILKEWPGKTLVMARLSFRNQRVGHGASLVTFLAMKARKLGYEYLGIEHTNENSAAFAKKLGFDKYLKTNNWVVNIDEYLSRQELSTWRENDSTSIC